MSQEDAIVSKVIEAVESLENSWVDLEVHYNHYGSRGVVDLVAEQIVHPDESRVQEFVESNEYITESLARDRLRSSYLWVYEIKSESAIDGVTGANEILRQFNSHREFFFQGSSYDNTYTGVKWALAFEFTDRVYQHLSDNEVIYRSLGQEEDVWLEWWDPDRGRLMGPFDDGDLVPLSELE